MVNFAIIASTLLVHHLVIESACFAREGPPGLALCVDFSLAQSAIALANKVLAKRKPTFINPFKIIFSWGEKCISC